MPTIYTATTDGGIRSYGPIATSWSSVRGNSGASYAFAVATSAQTNQYGPGVKYTGSQYTIYRTYFAFDVTGISSAVSSATFKFRSYVYANGDIIAVKSTKPNTLSNVLSGDFGACFIGGGLTAYSSSISGQGAVSAWHSITLNSTALSNMTSDDTLAICLMNYDHDYSDNAPTSTSTAAQRFGMYFADSTGTSDDPYIEYAVGYSHNVLGVDGTDISTVSGVAGANIASVLGVDT